MSLVIVNATFKNLPTDKQKGGLMTAFIIYKTPLMQINGVFSSTR